MKVLYTTSALSTGGRDGKVVVANNVLEFDMALPPELGGGKKTGYNPEQLFAAGYSACFGSAVQHVIRVKKLKIAVPDIKVEVSIGDDGAGGFMLAANIEVIFTGIDQALADSIAAEAHQVCPYSKATRGNIEVKVSASVK